MNFYNEHDAKAAAWLRELIKAGLIPAGDVDERSITEIKPHELTGYTQCHFFAGIGGWSLALELAGWPATRPVWTGSCPCQPFSSAGKQLGTADERHLWPVFFALIRECRPDCVFGEQVASAIGKGWLDGVSADLEGEGYACGATVLGAHSVGAPHIRQRLFWVADADSGRNGTGDARANQRAVSAADGGDFSGLGGGLADAAGGGQRIDGGASREGGHADERGEGGWLVNADGTGPQPGLAAAKTDRHGRAVVADGGAGWLRVSFAAECLGGDDGELGDECSVCGLDYANDCQCPGPTQDDEFEYDERDGVLFARRLVQPVRTGLERHAGDGDDGSKPGRIDADPDRPATAPSGNSWSTFDLIPCADGKARRIEPGLAPLAHGLPARVVRLRGYGNAIVPQVAAEFVQAFCESRA